MKPLIPILAILLFGFIFSHTAIADELFALSIESTYSFGPYTYASVDHAIQINGLQDQYVPSVYSLQLGNSGIIDAIAEINKDQQLVTFTQDEVVVSFTNNQIQNKAYQDFMIRYKAEEVLHKNGQLHVVNIPLLKSNTDISVKNQQIIVNFPQSWGKNITASTSFIQESASDNYQILRFDVKNSSAEEIQIAIGDGQIFDIQLFYTLSNETTKGVEKYIIIPPNLPPFQNVYVSSLNPMPIKIQIDQDANIYAYYKLKANQTRNVTFSGKVAISIKNIIDEPIKDNLIQYTIPDKYWESNDPEIESISSRLESTEQVFNFVASSLQYSNYKSLQVNINRLGAVNALKQPNEAVCMEYTDLSIALMRSNEIPAKEADGISYSNDLKETDRMHSWVVYYDLENHYWRNIDPTWASTTGKDYFNNFDTDHIILDVKGISSQTPDIISTFNDPDNIVQNIQVKYADSSQINSLPILQWIDNFNLQKLPWYTKVWHWVRGFFT